MTGLIHARRMMTLVMVAAAGTGSLPAQVPDGMEMQVNIATTGAQSNPAVAPSPGGGFVVVWTTDTSTGGDTSASAIALRLVDSTGTPFGSELQANSHSPGYQSSPAVAASSSGDFMVVWSSSSAASGDSFYSVQGQLFDREALPINSEFRVNTTVANVQESPSVAAGINGDFLVVWHSVGSTGDDSAAHSIQAQRYGSDGSPLGGEIQVNSFTSGSQVDPSIAALPTGGYVVTWFNTSGSVGDDSDGRSIAGRFLAADGTPSGGEFQVNSHTTGNQYNPEVAVNPGGEFVVVWSSNGSPTTDPDYTVLARTFDSTGSPVGPDFQVNSYTTYVQSMPTVASGPSGDFIIAWRSGSSGGGPDGDGLAVAAQAIDNDGGLLGSEVVVNTYTASHQSSPAVSGATLNRFLVTWQSDGSRGDDLDDSVQSMRWLWSLPFVDDFETGTTDAWSSTGP